MHCIYVLTFKQYTLKYVCVNKVTSSNSFIYSTYAVQ